METKKLSSSRASEKHFESKGISGKPISKKIQKQLIDASEEANKKIRRNEIVYSQSNLHAFEHIVTSTNNFNEEIEQELENLGLGGSCVPIKEEDKGTYEDYAKLEAQILLRTEENRNMLFQSSINAECGLPVGKEENKLVKKIERKIV